MSSLFTVRRSALSTIFFCATFIFAHPFSASSQTCGNNNFTIRTAICAGTVAWLEGSTPTGAAPFTYQWQINTNNCGNGGFTNITGATSKDYMVPSTTPVGACIRRVVNPAGCNNNSASQTIDANDRTTPAAPTATTVAPTCVTGTGTITVTSPTLNTGASSYAISGQSTATSATGSFVGLAPGTYSVTAISSTGCASPPLTVVLVQPTLSGSVSPGTASFCTGGSQVLTVTGPTGASFQWYRDGSIISGATSATYTATLSGTYTAEIILASCKNLALGSSVVTVVSPAGTISPATATICTGGTITLTATGNSGATFKWYKDGILQTGNTSNTFVANSSGTYEADVVIGTCSTRTNKAVVTAGTAPTGTISPAAITICQGNNTTLTATGGGTYQWSRNGQPIPGETNATLSTSQAGTYTVAISNGNCTGAASNSAVVTVAADPTGNILPASANICPGSSQQLVVSGGTSYQWYLNNIALPGQTTNTLSATQAGVYTADIINAAGCRAKAANSATITVRPSPTGSITPATATICGSGSVSLLASGGASYQWYLDGIAQTGAFTNTFVATKSGRYAVDIVDAAGCIGKSTNESIITVIGAPTGIISPATVSLCPGGSGTLTATSNGTSYQWRKDGQVIANQTAATLTVTAAGTYTVDIFSGTCQGSASNSSVVTTGAAPTGNITPASASLCSSGSVQLTARGGTSYQWSFNGTQIPGATSEIYNATQAGTYTALIISGSCSGPASNSVVVSPATTITFNAVGTNPSCTVPAGTITVSGVAGGSGSGYTYSKDNGASFQPGNTFVSLAAGTYQIVIKDGGGCRSNATAVTITAFTSTLAATVTSTPVSCTQPTSTVTVAATGGTGPFQYSLDGGAFQSNNSFSAVAAGTHKITTKDATACTAETAFTVAPFNSTLTVAAVPTSATCSQPNGSVALQASGGTAPYQFSLDGSTFQSVATFTNLTVGVHKALVKDNSGCVFEVSFTISQASGTPNLTITNPQRLCPDVTANLTLAAVTAGSDISLVYTYFRDAAATQVLVDPTRVSAGTYYIKATNSTGCSVVKPVVVSLQPVTAGVVFANRFTACQGDTISLAGTPGVSYQWYRNDTLLPGATNVVYHATLAGAYRVRIGDGTCAVFAANTIALTFNLCLPDATAFVPTAFTPNRNGANDVLRPVLYNVSTLQYFKVFNRWGKEVFQTTTIGRGWDGTINGSPQPAEAYTWILQCTGKIGNVIKLSGRSLLIR